MTEKESTSFNREYEGGDFWNDTVIFFSYQDSSCARSLSIIPKPTLALCAPPRRQSLSVCFASTPAVSRTLTALQHSRRIVLWPATLSQALHGPKQHTRPPQRARLFLSLLLALVLSSRPLNLARKAFHELLIR